MCDSDLESGPLPTMVTWANPKDPEALKYIEYCGPGPFSVLERGRSGSENRRDGELLFYTEGDRGCHHIPVRLLRRKIIG